MPVIAMQGLRGGTGATSITVALAWALQQLEESVLVIDFSPDNLLRLHFNMPFEQSGGWARASLDHHDWQQQAMRYTPLLDFLPFGQLNMAEQRQLPTTLLQPEHDWQEKIATLKATAEHRWILLDVPAGDNILSQQALALADKVIVMIAADAACHARLHQQALPVDSHFLLNQFSATSRLQQDMHQLWLQNLRNLLPLFIHRDEAVTEALAAKQPLGEYASQSLAADEVNTLANWCLIHCARGNV
ncbi:cellulose biosynthesis protein BcsQ [Yersinia ruckeri]|uniref:cellulose biosynthesis protein BcsQ n=1 Tax=Yersinia ruckeri TaxID=29486 RepID=UPI000537C466|nr:cellulose biosynthesis protein BcsQ [Yersinia ruckeri]AKA38813.1 cell division protein [Yersinia ruckeri]AUQ41630.1 cellulose synthase operon protein YhjQ [Yersinia ruckeri]EKN3345741.1 cellulose synthase operon protein YhjQ [Yersinia ruckeri]EKN3361468.1 cellulose synthase operon protein YhjQ [Yersinia ruckeri]EKN4200992.1 cellulose synthase operon protein YhjQ [Yersinia ruckeri]